MRYRSDIPVRQTPDYYLFSARLYEGADLELLERASALALEQGEKALTNRQLIQRALTAFVATQERERDAIQAVADVL